MNLKTAANNMRYTFYTTLFTIVFLLQGILSIAQSTGYMGNKLAVGYGLNVSPALINANANNETMLGTSGSADRLNPAFNVIHEGYLDAILSKKVVLGFSVRYYQTAYDNAISTTGFASSTYYTYATRPNGYYSLKGLTYTLYGRFYGSNYVAPWGRYILIGPSINTVETKYTSAMNIKVIASSGKDSTLYYFGPSKQNFTGVNVMMGWGRSRIFAERIVLDYGINFHFFSVISSFFDIVGTSEDGLLGLKEIKTSNYIESTYKYRVRGVNRVNAFIKVGILLF